MPCSVPGCKNDGAYTCTAYGADRNNHDFILCEKHMPNVVGETTTAEPEPEPEPVTKGK